MKFIYHPEVIRPREFNFAWYSARRAELLAQHNVTEADFGWDRQYDRTIDEDGNPGEYVQVWMRIEEEKC